MPFRPCFLASPLPLRPQAPHFFFELRYKPAGEASRASSSCCSCCSEALRYSHLIQSGCSEVVAGEATRSCCQLLVVCRGCPRSTPDLAYIPTSVSIRQHPSAHVSTRQHTSAHVSIRQHTSAYVSIRQHTSAYVSIRQHTSTH
jgi:hypothetical protein